MVVGAYYALSCFFSVKREEVIASVRTVQLNDTEMDYQAILNEFEDSELTTEGSLTTFTGYQTLNSSLFEGIDNVSESDVEALEGCKVGYKFTYDYESNIVTLYAQMQNELGELEIDTLSGVGFINEKGEIDAVMNVEGEGILLSEMRDAGMIQNCGWFAKAVKKVAQTVINVAVAVVAGAAAVAATAVVAAGVGTVGVAAAATIGTYALATAAVAAGVMLTVDMWEASYPGIKINKVKNITYATWDEKTREAIRDIVLTNKKSSGDPAIYFECVGNSNRPTKVRVDKPYTSVEMASLMSTQGKSSVTYLQDDAMSVIMAAVPVGYPIFLDVPTNEGGVPHYQAIDILSANYSAERPVEENPRYKVAGNTLHSFWEK